MNRLKGRTIVITLLSGALLLMLLLFMFKYETDGKKWASFPANSHVYDQGILTAGTVLDRNGTVLLETKEGKRIYHEQKVIRKSTLHVVGDAAGNIGSSAQTFFADKLIGYSMVNGVFSLRGEGRKLYLTIDAELNSTAYQALDGRKGCVAVYNYHSGEMLCQVSSPGFDPAAPPDPAAISSADGVYINRFLSSTFVPGSVYKLVTTAAAIDTLPNFSTWKFTCTGNIDKGESTITCPKAHGELDIYDALTVSCNCAFAQLAEELGQKKLAEYAEKTGLTRPVDVDGYQTAAGSFDADQQQLGQVAWSAIGQGNDLVNPCAMLNFMGGIANHGKAVTPKLIKKITTPAGIPVYFDIMPSKQTLLNKKTADTLSEMMRNNVVNNYGQSNFGQLPICAKSGTAEVGEGAAPHAWFVGFLQDPLHPLAFVVMVENGGGGSAVAGKIANKVLQEAYNAN
ncbi:MAG: penicillin-binding transpeptidase domain-containing protein [Clostridiales bacterium]